jgi:hypothetical protein
MQPGVFGPDGEWPTHYALKLQMGTDRGLPVHRYYVDQFLTEFASDIQGHCLEFQDPQYAPRFGGSAVTLVDEE